MTQDNFNAIVKIIQECRALEFLSFYAIERRYGEYGHYGGSINKKPLFSAVLANTSIRKFNFIQRDCECINGLNGLFDLIRQTRTLKNVTIVCAPMFVSQANRIIQALSENTSLLSFTAVDNRYCGFYREEVVAMDIQSICDLFARNKTLRFLDMRNIVYYHAFSHRGALERAFHESKTFCRFKMGNLELNKSEIEKGEFIIVLITRR